LLVTLGLPVAALGLLQVRLVPINTSNESIIDITTPGVFAFAIMATALTSQAIATAFDRRHGVLRLLATTPLGRTGLLGGKAFAVLGVLIVQTMTLTAAALALGWRPALAGVLPAALITLLGTLAFTSLGLLLAGTLRAEGVLAFANLLLIVLATVGGGLLPANQLPGVLATLAAFMPSGALSDALRFTLMYGIHDGAIHWSAIGLLAGWAALFTALAARFFRWTD
jgi:ABC-2 type transport system permease protein